MSYQALSRSPIFLKLDDEPAVLAAYDIRNGLAIPEDCCWPALRDLQAEELPRAAKIVENLEAALDRFRKVAMKIQS